MLSNNQQQVTYFIADIHLTQNRPDITACFLRFLQSEVIQAEKLYILGDLFEAWVGDDDDSELAKTVAEALTKLSSTGTTIFYIHGNRDFLLGKHYAQKSSMNLLPESTLIDLYGKKTLIMHGDTLCTRDVDYQKFRKKSRSWWWQALMTSLPLSLRKKKAENYRKRSAAATAIKAQEIMDVTETEVIQCLEQVHSQLLIHGHTHRPAIHHILVNGDSAQRIVLGDWYEQGAWLKVSPNNIELLNVPLINATPINSTSATID